LSDHIEQPPCPLPTHELAGVSRTPGERIRQRCMGGADRST